MRLLFTTWVFPTHGGVFDFMDKAIPYLVGRGHHCMVSALKPRPGSSREFPHIDRDLIHNIGEMPLPSPLSFPLLPFILNIVRTCRRREIDLIFCQDSFFSGLPSVVASAITGVPVVTADHGFVKNSSKPDYWENFGFPLVPAWRTISLLVAKLVIGRSSAVYAPGEDVADSIRGLFRGEDTPRILTFPIGIDTDIYRPNGELRAALRRELSLTGRLVATFVGRLHLESGLENLIEAAAGLEDNGAPIFLIVGDGNLRGHYERMAKSRVPGKFRFVGYSERIPEYLAASDIFVFPKVFAGGHSLALREAMAAGLPCIATKGVDSHDEIIESGRSGILIPPREPEALLAELRRLLDNEELRSRIGGEARRRIVELYSMEEFHDKLGELLSLGEDL